MLVSLLTDSLNVFAPRQVEEDVTPATLETSFKNYGSGNKVFH
jgi:hypothetical protein